MSQYSPGEYAYYFSVNQTAVWHFAKYLVVYSSCIHQLIFSWFPILVTSPILARTHNLALKCQQNLPFYSVYVSSILVCSLKPSYQIGSYSYTCSNHSLSSISFFLSFYLLLLRPFSQASVIVRHKKTYRKMHLNPRWQLLKIHDVLIAIVRSNHLHTTLEGRRKKCCQ